MECGTRNYATKVTWPILLDHRHLGAHLLELRDDGLRIRLAHHLLDHARSALHLRQPTTASAQRLPLSAVSELRSSTAVLDCC